VPHAIKRAGGTKVGTRRSFSGWRLNLVES
jgi:hypothetical protein